MRARARACVCSHLTPVGEVGEQRERLEPDAGVDRGPLFLPEMHVVLWRLEHRLGEANPLLLHVPYRVVGGKEDLRPCAHRA